MVKGWIYPIFALFLFLFFIPTQTFLLETIKIGGIKPDLGLIVAYLTGLAWGRERGLLSGLLVGGLQDYFAVGHLGLHCVFKGFIGFWTGVLDAFFIYFSLQSHAFAIFFISIFHDLLGEIILHGTDPGLTIASFTMVWRGLYNCVLTMAIMFLFLRFDVKRLAQRFTR
jgi:rod shape-determining protein MreD